MKGSFIILILIFSSVYSLSGQQDSVSSKSLMAASDLKSGTNTDIDSFAIQTSLKDTSDYPLANTLNENADSLTVLPTVADTLDPKANSIQNNTKNETVSFADSDLDSEIIFGAIDSQVYDNKSSIMHLYGEAYVKYKDKELTADYIQLDMNLKIADAQISTVKPNSAKPTFKEGDKTYTYKRLRYNFEKEKGLVYDAVTQEGEFSIHAEKTKYVSGGDNAYSMDDVIYNAHSLITTCNHEHPHFGFRARKLKVIPDKIAVLGPANLVLGGVPTPVVLPFGFFPLVQGKSSGFIFPQNYEFNSRALGFGFRGFGWYFPINNYVHLRLTADIYTRGSYGIYANTDYRKLYKYTGSFNLSFNDRRTEVPTDIAVNSEKGFSIVLNHRQDPKAHPFINVGGTIDIVANNNRNRIYNDAERVTTSVYNSNFYYRHSMPNTPFSFNLGLNHNQNTETSRVTMSFPDISLNMNTIFPFKRKDRGSNKEAWYEQISVKYDLAMKNYITTTDTTLFTSDVWDDMKSGVNQKVNLGFTTRVLKHFNFTPSANYTENWVFNTTERSLIPRVSVDSNGVESILPDSLAIETLGGFDTYRTYNAGANLSTQMFGTIKSSKGWLRGIRHTVKPSVGFSFAPDTRTAYTDTLFYTDMQRSPLTYTRFDQGAFSTGFSDLSSLLRVEVRNIVELKHWSKKDSSEKKIKIFDNFTVKSNYNFAKDSTQWDLIRINSTTRLFKNFSTLSTTWRFDPYMEDENNRAIKNTVWGDRKKIARLEYGEINWSNNFKIKNILDLFSKKEVKTRDEQITDRAEELLENNFEDLNAIDPLDKGLSDIDDADALDAEVSENLKKKKSKKQLVTLESLIESFSINYNLVYEFRADNNKVISKMRTHAISMRGSLQLTENWSIGIGNVGYNFVRKKIEYTRVTFSRKLHCWNMNFSWTPNRNTYSFFIGVNSSNLSFLKYNYGQNNFDGLGSSFR